MTYDQLLEIVRRYWADQSRSAEETEADLRTLQSEIDTLIEALR